MAHREDSTIIILSHTTAELLMEPPAVTAHSAFQMVSVWSMQRTSFEAFYIKSSDKWKFILDHIT